MKNAMKVVLVLIIAILVSGCYLNEQAEPNEIAVQLYKGQIESIADKPGGVYNDSRWFAEILMVDIGTQTFQVNDPEVLTSDNQAVGLTVTIQARRQTESLESLISNWNSLLDNEQFKSTISANAREAMKNGVRGFTLSQLLDDRNGLAVAITAPLEDDASKYGAEIVNITIENVSVDPAYLAILNEKAALRAQTERELERQKLITQQAENSILQSQKDVQIAEAQLLVEKAKTEIEVEIAEREGQKIAAQNTVYINNPQAFALEQLRLLKDVFNDKTVYFIPEGTDLTTLFGLNGITTLPK